MKTGTPVRIDAKSVHFELMDTQDGENDFHRFSFISEPRKLKQLQCWTCFTNEEAHEVLRSGLKDSPLFNGQIQSIGPRYCPSIETKIVTFPDKPQHQLFLEPEGETTHELYLNGFSSSLPMEIQLEALKKDSVLQGYCSIPAGIRYRIRLFRPDTAQAYAGIENRQEPVLRRTGKRNHRIRRSRRTGNRCRNQCAHQLPWRRTVRTGTRRSVYRRAYRRLGDQRRRRALPHVYLAGRIPHPSASGRC